MKTVLILASLFYLTNSFAQNFTIYGLKQDFPMGEKNEVIRKNFYLNIGSSQGIQPGTIMDVFRTLFIIKGSNSLEKINQRVKIGEIRVIHTEDNSSIGVIEKLSTGEKDPILEYKGFFIGDEVAPRISSR